MSTLKLGSQFFAFLKVKKFLSFHRKKISLFLFEFCNKNIEYLIYISAEKGSGRGLPDRQTDEQIDRWIDRQLN